MLKNRFITAVLGIPLIIGVLFSGDIYRVIFFTVMAIIALYEFQHMMDKSGIKVLYLPAYALLLFMLFSSNLTEHIFFLFFAITISIVAILVIRYPIYSIVDISMNFFAAFYIGFFLHYAVEISLWQQAFHVLLFTFILTWSSDVGGYFFGKLWGKNKMSSQLSPKKTWEGALGGIIMTVLFAFIYLLFNNSIDISNINLLILGILSSIFAQFGDLFVSAVKRYFNTKDAGKIIPGHGGVLDRFDSFFLVLPVIYYSYLFLI